MSTFIGRDVSDDRMVNSRGIFNNACFLLVEGFTSARFYWQSHVEQCPLLIGRAMLNSARFSLAEPC